MNLLTPIGKGQRLIVALTAHRQDPLAASRLANHPGMRIIMLLNLATNRMQHNPVTLPACGQAYYA